jgi:hypothetical protein
MTATARERDWKAAHTHFLKGMKIYLDLLDMPGTATAPALQLVFIPILLRYIRGERSQELYEEMMEDRL